MALHDNMCGPLHPLILKQGLYTLCVDVSILLVVSLELSPILLAMITTVILVAGQKLYDATILMILSGMVRGVKGRVNAVTEEDHGSVSSYPRNYRMKGCYPP